jgi:hypothetical protein
MKIEIDINDEEYHKLISAINKSILKLSNGEDHDDSVDVLRYVYACMIKMNKPES